MYKNHPNDQPTQADTLKRFKRFAQCLAVAGAERGVIYDLPRLKYKFVPLVLCDILTQHDGKTVADLKRIYNPQNTPQFNTLIDEYIDFLLQHDYIFWCDEEDLELFPDIDLHWDAPHHITNLIVDIDANSHHNWANIVEQVQQLNCQHLQIRSFVPQTLSFYDQVLSHFLTSVVRSVEIITAYSPDTAVEAIQQLIQKHLRIRSFIQHTSPQYELQVEGENGMGHIAKVTDCIRSANDCHIIDHGYFTVNIQLFTEAQHHHTYYNRKLGIDTQGNIKNCPSLTQSFGNINNPNINLKQIVQTPEFQRLWHIKKDETAICKDCEFRYMCVDSREPYLGNDGLYHHHTACPYNPYTMTWENDDTNKL